MAALDWLRRGDFERGAAPMADDDPWHAVDANLPDFGPDEAFTETGTDNPLGDPLPDIGPVEPLPQAPSVPGQMAPVAARVAQRLAAPFMPASAEAAEPARRAVQAAHPATVATPATAPPMQAVVVGSDRLLFPADMPDDQIQAAIGREYPTPAVATGAPPAPQSLGAAIEPALTRGIFQGLGTAVQGAGALARRAGDAANEAQRRAIERIDRGEAVPEMEDPAGYQHMTPEQRAGYRAELAKPPLPVGETGVYRAGQEITDWARRTWPVSPENEARFIPQVAEALGTTVGFVAAALLGGSPVLGGMALLSGAGEAAQNAVESGKATDEQTTRAAVLGMGPGALDWASIEALMRPMQRSPGLVGLTVAVIKKAIEQGVIEGTTEGIQQVIQNIIARTGYDPDKALLDQVWENFTIGGAVGVLTGGIAGAVAPPQRRTPAAVAPARAEPPPPATPIPPMPPTGPAVPGSQAGPGVVDVTPRISVPPTAAEARAGLEAALGDGRPLAEQAADQQAQANQAAAAALQQEQIPMGRVSAAVGDAAVPATAEGFAAPEGPGIRLTDDQGAVLYEGPAAGAPALSPLAGDGSRTDPVKATTPQDVAVAEARVAEPTPGQAEAGNYQKGHVEIQGLPISIEVPRGGTRRAPDGSWEVRDFPVTYGYVKRTEGADGDQVDVYIGDNPSSPTAFLIDQIDPATGRFDEHKIVLGAESQGQAAIYYTSTFSDGSGGARIGAITPMSVEQVKAWLKTGNAKEPVAYVQAAPTDASGNVDLEAATPEDLQRMVDAAAAADALPQLDEVAETVDDIEERRAIMEIDGQLSTEPEPPAPAPAATFRRGRIEYTPEQMQAFQDAQELGIDTANMTPDEAAMAVADARETMEAPGEIAPAAAQGREGAAPVPRSEPGPVAGERAGPAQAVDQDRAERRPAQGDDRARPPASERGGPAEVVAGGAPDTRPRPGRAGRGTRVDAARDRGTEQAGAGARPQGGPATVEAPVRGAAAEPQPGPGAAPAGGWVENVEARRREQRSRRGRRIWDMLLKEGRRHDLDRAALARRIDTEGIPPILLLKSLRDARAAKRPPQKPRPGNKRKKAPKAPDIVQWIAQNGGIRDIDGVLKKMDVARHFTRFGPMVRRNGDEPSVMARRLVEAGYIPKPPENAPEPDIVSVMYEKIDETINRDRRQYSDKDLTQIEDELAGNIDIERELHAMWLDAEKYGIADQLPQDATREQLYEALIKVMPKFQAPSPVFGMVVVETPDGWRVLDPETNDASDPYPSEEAARIAIAMAEVSYVRLNKHILMQVRPAEMYDERQAEIRRAVETTVRRFVGKDSPDLTVHLADKLWAKHPAAAAGAETWTDVWGLYQRGDQLVLLSLQSDRPIYTLRHEFIHAFRDMGVISPQEWTILAATARKERWADKHNVAERWPNLTGDAAIEEAVAEEFGLRAREEPGDALIYRIIARIETLLRRIRAAMRQIFGRPVTAEDLFVEIESGRKYATWSSVIDADTLYRQHTYEVQARADGGWEIVNGEGDVQAEFAARDDAMTTAQLWNNETVKWQPAPAAQPLFQPAPKPPAIDQTDQGDQYVIPGAEKIGVKELIERKMEGRKKPGQPQAAVSDLPLFGGADRQKTLFQTASRASLKMQAAGVTRTAKAKALADALRGDAGPPLPFVEDAGWLRRTVLMPRQIAALFKQFTPIWNTAVAEIADRDRIAADLHRLKQPYDALTDEQRRRVDAILELGRLMGKVFEPGVDEIIEVQNPYTAADMPERGAQLSKPGEVLRTASPIETDAYLAIRKFADRALDLFRDQVLREFGFDPKAAATPTTSKAVDALIEQAEKALAGMAKAAKEKAAPKAPGEAVKAETMPDMKKAALGIKHLKRLSTLLGDIEIHKRRGYIPFNRPGNYFIRVLNKDGDAVYRTHLEVPLAERSEFNPLARGSRNYHAGVAQQMRERLKERFPAADGYTVEDWQKVTPKTIADMPDAASLENLLHQSTLDAATRAKVTEAFDEVMRKTGFRAHFITARNTPGYSTDFQRSFADYATSLSGYLAGRKARPAFDEALRVIPAEMQKLRQYAQEYVDYIHEPKEEFGWLRTAGFVYYLAGRIGSAAVNALQVRMVTAPYLYSIANPAVVEKELTRAYNDVRKMVSVDALKKLSIFDPSKAPEDVRADLKKAFDAGWMVPLEAFNEMAAARGKTVLARQLGEKAQTALDVYAVMFTGAERLNRIVTFIAAHRLARRAGVIEKADATFSPDHVWDQRRAYWKTPLGFGQWITDSTHYVPGKINRPTMMRGIGTSIFQFKGYTINTLTLLWNMYAMHAGTRTKIAATSAMVFLVAMGGIFGLPLADDVKDIADFLVGLGGVDWSLEDTIREAVADLAGPAAARWFARGPIRDLTDLDLSKRTTLGNVIPDMVSQDPMAALAAIFGIPFDMLVNRPLRAIKGHEQGDIEAVLQAALPEALADIVRANQMATRGVVSRNPPYRVNIANDTVLPDGSTTADTGNWLARAAGFQPTGVARMQEAYRANERMKRATTQYAATVNTRLAREIVAQDKAITEADKAASRRRFQEVADEIDRYNRNRESHEQLRPFVNGRPSPGLRAALEAERKGRYPASFEKGQRTRSESERILERY